MNSIVRDTGRENRRQRRLNAEAEFKNTTWSVPAKGFFHALFRERHAASIVDISQGGVGIITNSTLKPNTYIELNICFRDYQPFSVEGRVRSVREYGKETIGGKEITFYRAGLQFEALDPDSSRNIDIIMKLVNHRQGEANA